MNKDILVWKRNLIALLIVSNDFGQILETNDPRLIAALCKLETQDKKILDIYRN